MANPGYLRSTDGDDADNGSTWALANATFSGAAADAVAGDRIWVSQAHAGSGSVAITVTFPGTTSNPNEILCGNDAAEPPTALATGGEISTTPGNGRNIAFAGSFYAYGIKISPCKGSSANYGAIIIGSNQTGSTPHAQFWESSYFNLPGYAGGNTYIGLGSNLNFTIGSSLRLVNCTYDFNNGTTPSGGIVFTGDNDILGGSVINPGNVISATSVGGHRGIRSAIVGLDMSSVGSGKTVFNVANLCHATDIAFIGCKLGSGAALITGTFPDVAANVGFYGCDSGDLPYQLQETTYGGSIYNETVVVRTGTLSTFKHNATDITISRKYVSASPAKYPLKGLINRQAIAVYNEITSSQTATIEICHFGAAALTDGNIMLRLAYFGTSGSTLLAINRTIKADILTSATNLTASTQAWDSKAPARANSTAYSVGDIIKVATNPGRLFRCTAGGTSAGSEPAAYASAVDGDSITDGGATFRTCRRQKASTTFTAAEQGPIVAHIELFLAGVTVFVDPAPVLT